jgi:hypothetical protein
MLLPGPAWTMVLPISASHVGRIVGMSLCPACVHASRSNNSSRIFPQKNSVHKKFLYIVYDSNKEKHPKCLTEKTVEVTIGG